MQENTNLTQRALALLASATILSACDSGSSGSSAPRAEVFEGTFVDSPVQGLYYETESRSGLTDAQGTFTYHAGETVTFRVGNTELGRAPGQALLTPFDISGHRPLDTEAEIIASLESPSPSSFDKALNIANLLQQLDQDGNPENGINLGNAHKELSNHNIPLYHKARSFLDSEALQSAKDALNLDFDRNFSDVLEHLYTSLEIEVSASQTEARLSEDRATHFEYNEEGLVSSISFDTNNDGEMDKEQYFEYDDQGRLAQITDSQTTSTERLEYDNDSNLISRSRSINSVLESEETFSYQNNRLMEFSLSNYTDGSSDIRHILAYNDDGLLDSISSDTDGDTVDDTSTAIVYRDTLAKEYHQTRLDDTSNELSISYNHDSNGNIIQSSSQKTAGDETHIEINSFEYDTNNRPTRYELDRDLDGFPDYIEAYRYNQSGKRTEYKKDTNGDGNWNFVAQYSYDVDGNRIRMIEDSDGNGIVDKVWEAEYQAARLENPWNTILEQL